MSAKQNVETTERPLVNARRTGNVHKVRMFLTAKVPTGRTYHSLKLARCVDLLSKHLNINI